MSVIIRNFDKPSDCDYCTLQDDGYCNVLLSFINVEHGVDTRCPIIEINEYTMKNGHKVVVADTPQTEMDKCYKCKWWNYSYGCSNKKGICEFEPIADTPQTDVYDYKGNGKWERSE